MSGCLPLVFSWIYLIFPRFCPPSRDLMRFPLVSRLNSLGQISRDTHAQRMLDFRNELDRVGVDDVRIPDLRKGSFACFNLNFCKCNLEPCFGFSSCRPLYMAPQWRVIEPGWVNEVGEIETWLATVPIILFMYVRFHHVDRVKRQFGSEQVVPSDPVNLDEFFRASARGDDKWWPTELAYWYGFWHNQRARDHQILIVPTHYPGWPTKEYADWWAVACRRRFLSLDRLLQDPRGAQLLDDHPDIRRKGEGAPTSGRSNTQPGGEDVDEVAEYRRQDDIPEGAGAQDQGGDDHTPHEPDIDFFFGADLELARFILHGEGSGSGSAPHASTDGPSGHHHYEPPQDMYEVFSCGEQTMDHIVHEYIASRTSDDAVYRPVVLPTVTAVVLSVTFTGSAALPAPVQLSHTIAPATVLSECVTAFTPPIATRRSVLPLRARAIAPPHCSPTGTAATKGLPSGPIRHIIPSLPSPSARGRPGLGSATCLF
ncbi:hypothetical protein PIB30_066068 [Stylosanthes scabra]|uniref:Aminotransferase-like plant mobile domain-containing protein n=1 Tax=Stylosanthes scabra TaxID=79078 RepID=A0ABU6UMS7_9FABA|nr:hypothetical protein [Stylosanthes scabra]